MPLIPPGVLTDMKNVVNSSLIDQMTIARTGATVNCRIDIDTAEAKVHGMPSFFKAPRWQVTVPVDTDLAIGDVGTTIAGDTAGDSYSILEVENPITYGVAVVAQAIRTSIAMNPFATAVVNATVTFQRQNADKNSPNFGGYDTTQVIGVYIEPVRDIPELGLAAAKVLYRVYFPLPTTINGTRIAAGDRIVWSELRKGFANLERPAYYDGPVQYGEAIFSEAD